MGIVLKGENLVKDYGSKHVVKNVSFSVEQGEIIGLLGPNGAGKTTLIRMINQITAPDEGEILFFGNKLNKLPKQNFFFISIKEFFKRFWFAPF